MGRTALYIFFTFLPVLFLSCVEKARPLHSFYFWKLQGDLTKEDTMLKNKLGISHSYIHYMDISWSEALNMAVPRATQQINNLPGNEPYTPVIYIDNRVFEKSSQADMDTMARRILRRIEAMTRNMEGIFARNFFDNLHLPYDSNYQKRITATIDSVMRSREGLVSEVQIDCDWTEKTRDNYFLFLRQFKALLKNKDLSVTIRLYPFKYRSKMGIPPADRGVLMCYNLSPIAKPETGNSVFDLSVLRQYLTPDEAYPLPLDLALPVFGWHPWFRGGKLQGILYPYQMEVDTQ
ncbi:MAG: hypothetical protein EOO01_30430, partial [Chitinophagaceae bacterium]